MKEIYLGKSKIAGKGIFTKEVIKKGEFVCRLKGKKFHWKYNEKTDRELGANWFGLGKDIWVDPAFPLSHINHSCGPNLGMKGKIMFYALRDIQPGEELTFDYAISEEENSWRMRCHCGSKKCRGYMTAIQELPKKVFYEYLPYIPTYFQKVYKRYNSIQD